MQELENASRRAQQLWGKDAATVDEEGKKSRRGSLGSAYARTVIGPSASALDLDLQHGVADSHNIRCDVCRKVSNNGRLQCSMADICPDDPWRTVPMCDVPIQATAVQLGEPFAILRMIIAYALSL